MPKTILIVEDDPKNAKLFKDLLEISGYEVCVAENGKIGTEMAREILPDLILMDILMPVMDGLQATQVLKREDATKNIHIMALTSYAMKGDRERIMASGVDSYMTKPIDTREFLDAVKELLGNDAA